MRVKSYGHQQCLFFCYLFHAYCYRNLLWTHWDLSKQRTFYANTKRIRPNSRERSNSSSSNKRQAIPEVSLWTLAGLSAVSQFLILELRGPTRKVDLQLTAARSNCTAESLRWSTSARVLRWKQLTSSNQVETNELNWERLLTYRSKLTK